MKARYEIRDADQRVVAESYSRGIIQQTYNRRFSRFGGQYTIVDTFKEAREKGLPA